MRLVIAAFCFVLLIPGLGGLGLGVYIFATVAALTPPDGQLAAMVAIHTAAPVLTLGAVSTGLVAVVLVLDQARAEQVAVLERANGLTAEQLRRESPPRDPALAAKRARIAAEQESRIEAARARSDV